MQYSKPIRILPIRSEHKVGLDSTNASFVLGLGEGLRMEGIC